jgi:hypothetical protein
LETEEDGFIDIEHLAKKLPAVQKPAKESARKIVKFLKRTSYSELGSSSPALADDPIPVTELSYNSNRKQAKPRKRIPMVEDRSSSPTMAGLPTPKTTKNLQKATVQKAPPVLPAPKSARSLQKLPLQNHSAAVPTPEPPASLLRIKARPPRKMMMLMDRPSSRTSDIIEPSTTSRPKPTAHQNFGLDSSEVVPSQATLHLDAFCHRQGEIMQARLNVKCTALNLEDILSSPEDRGIDHQTIDLLLSRKTLPVETKPAIEQNLTTPKSPDPNPGKQIELSPSEIEDSVENISISKSKDISNLVSGSAIDGSEIVEVACPKEQDRSLELDAKGERRNSTSHGPAPQNEGVAISPIVTTKSPLVTVATKGEEERILTKVSQSSPSMSKFPEHVSSVIQAATDRFRAMIKSSAGSEIQLGVPIASRPEKTIEAELTLSVPLLYQKQQTLSSAVAVKPSPESSLIRDVSSIETEQLAMEPESTEALRDTFQKAAGSVANPTQEAPKTRLANPATRGKSLQSIAANTVDSLAPAFSLMPPPPPQQRTRPQKNIERNIAVEERPPPGGYEGDRTAAGPWSRESYDLFGSWVPPGGFVKVGQANSD